MIFSRLFSNHFSRTRRIVISVGALGAAALIGTYTVMLRPVTVIADGTSYQTRTFQPTVRDLLRELGFPLRSQDLIQPALETPIQAGQVVTLRSAQLVLIGVDGQVKQHYTLTHDPLRILQEAGIALFPNDLVLVDGAPLPPRQERIPQHLAVIRTRKVEINDNGSRKTIASAHLTVGEILSEAKLNLYAADRITPEPTQLLGDDNRITIVRAVAFTVRVDGRTFTGRSSRSTVGAALSEIGLAPVGLDYTIPDLTAPLTADLEIKIVRVTEDELVEQLPIPYKQVVRVNPDLTPGTQQIEQVGSAGLQERRIRVRREDGIEVSRAEPYTVIVQAPRDEIVVTGPQAQQ